MGCGSSKGFKVKLVKLGIWTRFSTARWGHYEGRRELLDLVQQLTRLEPQGKSQAVRTSHRNSVYFVYLELWKIQGDAFFDALWQFCLIYQGTWGILFTKNSRYARDVFWIWRCDEWPTYKWSVQPFAFEDAVTTPASFSTDRDEVANQVHENHICRCPASPVQDSWRDRRKWDSCQSTQGGGGPWGTLGLPP